MKAEHIAKLTLATFFFFTPLANLASEPSLPTLSPFTATYSTIWHKGISLRVEGKQTLSKQSDQQWRFEFSANTLIANLKESSLFLLPEDSSPIKPLQYTYRSSILGRKREATIDFDWENQRAKNNVKNTPWYMDIEPGTIDRLGLQLQIRRDLRNQVSPLSYQIADGGKVKQWEFKREKTEKLNTQLGYIDTIKVIRTDNKSDDRLSTFWFAPKYDYLLVRMVHKEDGESYKLELENIR